LIETKNQKKEETKMETTPTPNAIKLAIARAIKAGNWMIRRDVAGIAHNGFRWSPLGEWTEAPDWDEQPRCGGGLHGCNYRAAGQYSDGARLVFCETDGPQIVIDGDKIKVRRARIMMIDALPDGLTVGGSLYLSGCSGLTALPDGLTVGGWLNLRGCSGLTALPDGLTVGGGIFR
jgi:hypothetical protein